MSAIYLFIYLYISTFSSSLLAGGVGFGAPPRPPQPPGRQKPRAGGSAAKKSSTLDDANLKRLASQELQIKSLNNLIVELQNENESIKVENRTLRQVRPSVLRLGFKTSSSTFALGLILTRKLLMPSYRRLCGVHDAGSRASAAQNQRGKNIR